MRICYFGGYRPEYPRNRFYRSALQLLGVEVVECRVTHKLPTVSKMWRLALQFWRGAHTADTIVVAEFNHSVVPLAWLLARLTGQALVFDPGLSHYDEIVLRAKEVAPNSWYGRYLWLNNWLAFRLPDLVIWFTPVDMEYFQALFKIPVEHCAWLPPGVDRSMFAYMPLPEVRRPLVVHFDGNMSPTHGIDVILQAAALLSPADFQFEIIGGGMVKEMRALASRLRLTNVSVPGVVSDDELESSMRRAHICLGAFRHDDKLRRSLYTKEIQAMLSGRALVTGYGEAKARLFRNGEDLIMVEPDNPVALAEALTHLQKDPERLAAVAANAHRAAERLLSPENTGAKLLQLLSDTLERRNRRFGADIRL